MHVAHFTATDCHIEYCKKRRKYDPNRIPCMLLFITPDHSVGEIRCI